MTLEHTYHSRFGGMWIDRSDFPTELKRRVRERLVPKHLAEPLTKFERDGYIVLERAASESALDQFEDAITRAFRDGNADLIRQNPGDQRPLPVTAGMERRRSRIVDSFVALPSALDLLSSPRLVEFLRTIFDETPLLFQSLSFDMGSEQGLHQDTAYVVVDKRPMEMAACWIALEDVREGSGELQYLVGSHRLGDYKFGEANTKHWNEERDGAQSHFDWSIWIGEEGARRGMAKQKFMAKRGDILIWHGDLAHGGSPIGKPDLTRKSLVGHFCPVSADPYYFVHAPDRAVRRQYGDLAYASWHYDLSKRPQLTPASASPKPPRSVPGWRNW